LSYRSIRVSVLPLDDSWVLTPGRPDLNRRFSLVELEGIAPSRAALQVQTTAFRCSPVGSLFAEYCSFVPPKTNTARRLRRQE
jgi:hypothetical protein